MAYGKSARKVKSRGKKSVRRGKNSKSLRRKSGSPGRYFQGGGKF